MSLTVDSDISTPQEQPSTPSTIPKGWELTEGGAVCKIVVDGKKFKVTIPISDMKDAAKVLAKYDAERLNFMGKICIGAGVGKDAVGVDFETNENGGFKEVEVRLKGGHTQVLDEKYFQVKRDAAQNDPAKLQEVHALESAVKKLDKIFEDRSFKAENLHTAVPEVDKNLEKEIGLESGSSSAEFFKRALAVIGKPMPGTAKEQEFKFKLAETEVDVNNSKNHLSSIFGYDEKTQKRIDDYFYDNIKLENIKGLIDDLKVSNKEKNISISDIELLGMQREIDGINKRRKIVQKESSSIFKKDFLESWLKHKKQNPTCTINEFIAYQNK